VPTHWFTTEESCPQKRAHAFEQSTPTRTQKVLQVLLMLPLPDALELPLEPFGC
jgi:hypothetical protein